MPATKPTTDDRTAGGETFSVRAVTVGQLAERYAVKPHVILALIKSGDLKALNIAAPGAKRPHWRIMPDELAAFEALRAALPNEPAPRRRKAKAGVELIDPTTGKIRREFRALGSAKAAQAMA